MDYFLFQEVAFAITFLATCSHVLYGSGLCVPAGRGTERRGAGISKSDRANQKATAYLVCATIIGPENI
jgi:hypothetical protein